MKKCLGILAILFCGAPAFAQRVYAPCDKLATRETVWLYGSMQRLVGAGVMFGHHDDTAYGVGWRHEDNRSDVKSVTGPLYPHRALYRLGHLHPKTIRRFLCREFCF